MTKEKYALLDTDFISKTHLILKDDHNKLIDRIMEMQGYRFYCHEQIQAELKRHNIGNSPEWLEAKISDGTVHCTTDEEIIDELHAIYSDSAEAMYANMLKNGSIHLKIRKDFQIERNRLLKVGNCSVALLLTSKESRGCSNRMVTGIFLLFTSKNVRFTPCSIIILGYRTETLDEV